MGERYDAVVIGAGFGGLGAALTLASAGARVLLCEALAYPGGCASTFTRQGARYEAGATLFSGFGEGQLFARWVEEHSLNVCFTPLDPMISLRTPDFCLDVPPDRERLVANILALPEAPVEKIRAFFAFQRQIADTLWRLFDDPTLLPAAPGLGLLRHLWRAPAYLPLLPLLGTPLLAVLRRFGVADFGPLRTWCDAVCQITVQAGVDEAEAPFALAAMDYPLRGTGHIHGGIGVLAHALCTAVRARGGEVRLATRARAIRREKEGWTVNLRGEEVLTRVVLANLLPQSLPGLLGPDTALPAWVGTLGDRVADGWGAAMRYLRVRADASLRPGPHHIELVIDPAAPFSEGNHLFCSVSGADETDRAPDGQRTATISTHVRMTPFLALSPEARGAHLDGVHARMDAALAALAPELHAATISAMTASPRTFARFTRRPLGYVGGIPRRAGLWNYEVQGLFPRPVLPGLYLVGDTVFPGQSTLATALGGKRAAEHALTALG